MQVKNKVDKIEKTCSMSWRSGRRFFLAQDRPFVLSLSLVAHRGRRLFSCNFIRAKEFKLKNHLVWIDLEMTGLDPDTGLRALVHGHRDDILGVEVDVPGILRDIDTPEDYKRETGRQR